MLYNNIEELYRDIALSTVKLTAYKETNISSGSSFFFTFKKESKYITGLITNKHVISNALKLEFQLHIDYNISSRVKKFTIVKEEFDKYIIEHPSKNIDLCFINLSSILDEHKDIKYFSFYEENLYISNSNNISFIEPIFTVGYPSSLEDDFNKLPIFMKGNTATNLKYDYQGNQMFLIDLPVYPGSSGSPVLLYSNDCTIPKIAGILFATHLYNPTKDISIPNNLGLVIKALKIMDLLHLI